MPRRSPRKNLAKEKASPKKAVQTRRSKGAHKPPPDGDEAGADKGGAGGADGGAGSGAGAGGSGSGAGGSGAGGSGSGGGGEDKVQM